MSDDSRGMDNYHVNMMRNAAHQAFKAAGLKYDSHEDIHLEANGEEFTLLGKKSG